MGTEERAGRSPAEAGGSRKIIHIDMDAFYASVEQRDNPELRGKPVAVGGSRERGVVAAASYEARKFGVHSAMASITAKRKCRDLIFVKPRFDAYKAISLQIREIFAEYTPIIEPLSLDEASRILHFHPAYLVRSFGREFGMSPHRYLVSRRVDLARRLILAGEPLRSVAAGSGFYDQPHLARHFKRILGVSPGAFLAEATGLS